MSSTVQAKARPERLREALGAATARAQWTCIQLSAAHARAATGGRWGEGACAHLGHKRVALPRPNRWSGYQARPREHPGAWRDEIAVSSIHGAWQASRHRRRDSGIPSIDPTTRGRRRQVVSRTLRDVMMMVEQGAGDLAACRARAVHVYTCGRHVDVPGSADALVGERRRGAGALRVGQPTAQSHTAYMRSCDCKVAGLRRARLRRRRRSPVGYIGI